MAKATSTIWPKPYLLECYQRAIDEGCVELAFESHEQFKSFQAAFYRLRRRDDDQYKDFVKQSFHLCSCAWDSQRNVGYIIYDKLPKGAKLPKISSVDTMEMESRTLPNPPMLPPIDVTESPQEPEAPFDSAGMVKDLLKNISFKGEAEPDSSDIG